MLSFTDNRQDASLQAGHFNDFIEVGVLRSALYRAAQRAGTEGLRHEELTQQVFNALDLPLDAYASDPGVKYQALAETQRALRNVLGYRLYRDLKRGWRITSPNLEQCGLLDDQVPVAGRGVRDEDVWRDCHAALASATPETQDAGQPRAARLHAPRARHQGGLPRPDLPGEHPAAEQPAPHRSLGARRKRAKEYATILFPRGRGSDDYRSNVYLSARGGFGQYLRRGTTFGLWRATATWTIPIRSSSSCWKACAWPGWSSAWSSRATKDDKPGYQLPASAMIWVAGDGNAGLPRPHPRPAGVERRAAAPTPSSSTSTGPPPPVCKAWRRANTPPRCPTTCAMEREDDFRHGEAAGPLLLAHDGTWRRHRRTQRREHAQRPADAGQLCPAQRSRGPQRPAGAGLLLLLHGQSARPVFLQAARADGGRRGDAPAARPGQRGPGARARPCRSGWRRRARAWDSRSRISWSSAATTRRWRCSAASARASRTQARADERACARRACLETLRDELSDSDWYTDGWLDEVLDQVCQQLRPHLRPLARSLPGGPGPGQGAGTDHARCLAQRRRQKAGRAPARGSRSRSSSS